MLRELSVYCMYDVCLQDSFHGNSCMFVLHFFSTTRPREQQLLVEWDEFMDAWMESQHLFINTILSISHTICIHAQKSSDNQVVSCCCNISMPESSHTTSLLLVDYITTSQYLLCQYSICCTSYLYQLLCKHSLNTSTLMGNVGKQPLACLESMEFCIVHHHKQSGKIVHTIFITSTSQLVSHDVYISTNTLPHTSVLKAM